jgi:hypothetical protein
LIFALGQFLNFLENRNFFVSFVNMNKTALFECFAAIIVHTEAEVIEVVAGAERTYECVNDGFVCVIVYIVNTLKIFTAVHMDEVTVPFIEVGKLSIPQHFLQLLEYHTVYASSLGGNPRHPDQNSLIVVEQGNQT